MSSQNAGTRPQPVEPRDGMTLRVWFARRALIGLIAAAGNLAAGGDMTSGEGASTGRRNEQ